MKNNFITKIIGATLAFAMMIGGAVGINAAKQAKEVNAATATYKLTIDASDFNTTSYAANNNEKTSNAVCTTDNTKEFEVKWTSNQVMKNSSNMQWQKSKGYIYNSTNLGTIASVTVTSSDGTFTTYYGTSAQPSSGAAGSGKGYFKTSVGDATGKSSKLEVVFTITEGGGSSSSSSSSSSSAPETYRVTYASGGATSGSVPTDNTEYTSGATVTVLGNTGNLEKEDYEFGGWTNGNNTYAAGDTFTISSNTTLTAVWNYAKHYTEDVNESTITWDLSKPEYVSSSEEQVSWESPKATMVANKETASTATNNYLPPKYTSTRFYQNSSLTITPASGYQINSVVFTATTDGYATALKNSSWTNASATANSTTVTVVPTDKKASFSATIGANTGHTRVVVHYGVAVYDPTLSLDKYAVSMKTNNTIGVDVTATVDNVASPTYSWTTSDSNITLVNPTSRTVTIKPDTEEAGSATVHLAIGNTDANLEADVSVTLTLPSPGETAGTAYTVQQAKDSIDEKNAQNGVYVRGIISQIDSYNSTYHSITYWISDDGTTANQFEVYSGKGLDNADFSSKNDLVLGSSVVIYGNIKLYSGVYEFGSGSKIVSLILPPQVNSVTLNPETISVEPGSSGDIVDLFTNIVINQDDGSNKTISDIVWTSDDNDVFAVIGDQYIAGDTHRTSTTIHASIGETEYATATVNVINSAVHSVPYSVPVSWTKLNSLAAGDTVAFVYEKDNVKKELTGVSTTGTTIGEVTDYDENPSGSFLLTVEAGNKENSFAFKTINDTYLSWSSGNSLTTSQTKNDNSSWRISANHDGSDEDWKFANVATSERILQFNVAQPRFACYANDGQSVFQIYKKTGGYSSAVDLLSASSTATLHATESNEGGYLTLSDVKIRFGAKLSIAEWEAVEAIGNITDYGVMFFRTRNAIASETPVQDAINNGKTPAIISKGSGEVPSDPENGYYSFTGTVNITKESNYDLVFCAAPFIEVDGTAYFLDELQFSVNSLANYIIDHNVETELSDDALLLLA